MEVLIASSSIDAGIGCWDVQTGNEQLRYKTCASPAHGLVCVGDRFLASSQLRDSSPAASGSVFYWSFHKPQVEVKSFPSERIQPLVANSGGTYLIGGGASGEIYLWEVATGRLLKKWHGHYISVTCLALSEDDSLLISGSGDGGVRVWNLVTVFDDIGREPGRNPYEYSFSEHTLAVTDVKVGYGASNAIIVSASEDRSCKVWSLSTGRLLRNIVFPSVVNAIALDPGEHVFYAGGRDGRIYIVALSAESPSNSNYGAHIIGSLSDQSALFVGVGSFFVLQIFVRSSQPSVAFYLVPAVGLSGSKAVTSLAICHDGISLVSGSEDGFIRIWNTRSCNIVRMFRHAKGAVNNILVIRRPVTILKPQTAGGRRQSQFLLPPLEKYTASTEDIMGIKTCITGEAACFKTTEVPCLIEHVMSNQIKEIEQQGSSAAAKVEIEQLKVDCERAMLMVQQWKKTYENLHQFCVDELLDAEKVSDPNISSA